MGNEVQMRIFGASGGVSCGAPSRRGKPIGRGTLGQYLVLQSSILTDFYNSLIDTDWVSQCPALAKPFYDFRFELESKKSDEPKKEKACVPRIRYLLIMTNSSISQAAGVYFTFFMIIVE